MLAHEKSLKSIQIKLIEKTFDRFEQICWISRVLQNSFDAVIIGLSAEKHPPEKLRVLAPKRVMVSSCHRCNLFCLCCQEKTICSTAGRCGKNRVARGQKSLFLQKVPFGLHYANSDGIFHILNVGFCGKNLKNKSYRMPFIVKKCKVFHF